MITYIKVLQRNKKILKEVIKECKAKLPMCKMTYPEAILTDIMGLPKYKESIKQAKEAIDNINRLEKMKKYPLKNKDRLVFTGKQIIDYKRAILNEVLVKFRKWYDKLGHPDEINNMHYITNKDYQRFTRMVLK